MDSFWPLSVVKVIRRSNERRLVILYIHSESRGPLFYWSSRIRTGTVVPGKNDNESRRAIQLGLGRIAYPDDDEQSGGSTRQNPVKLGKMRRN